MRTAIIGANGQLGADVCVAFESRGHEVIRVNHTDVDVGDLDRLSTLLRDITPQFVINTAALHHVEKCERDPQLAFAVNAIGARNLALISNDVDFVLVHVSTDYVFDGMTTRPYRESDPPGPLNVYGNSKLAGEYFVQSISKRYFVLRTSALYGRSPCRAKGQNFIELMLRLGKERTEVRVVDSERVTPTWTVELAEQIVRLTQTSEYGLYHTTAIGSCTWYEFAREIFLLTGCATQLSIAAPDEFPSKVRRPTYSVLENAALNAQGWNMFTEWREGLRNYLHLR